MWAVVLLLGLYLQAIEGQIGFRIKTDVPSDAFLAAVYTTGASQTFTAATKPTTPFTLWATALSPISFMPPAVGPLTSESDFLSIQVTDTANVANPTGGPNAYFSAVVKVVDDLFPNPRVYATLTTADPSDWVCSTTATAGWNTGAVFTAGWTNPVSLSKTAFPTTSYSEYLFGVYSVPRFWTEDPPVGGTEGGSAKNIYCRTASFLAYVDPCTTIMLDNGVEYCDQVVGGAHNWVLEIRCAVGYYAYNRAPYASTVFIDLFDTTFQGCRPMCDITGDCPAPIPGQIKFRIDAYGDERIAGAYTAGASQEYTTLADNRVVKSFTLSGVGVSKIQDASSLDYFAFHVRDDAFAPTQVFRASIRVIDSQPHPRVYETVLTSDTPNLWKCMTIAPASGTTPAILPPSGWNHPGFTYDSAWVTPEPFNGFMTLGGVQSVQGLWIGTTTDSGLLCRVEGVLSNLCKSILDEDGVESCTQSGWTFTIGCAATHYVYQTPPNARSITLNLYTTPWEGCKKLCTVDSQCKIPGTVCMHGVCAKPAACLPDTGSAVDALKASCGYRAEATHTPAFAATNVIDSQLRSNFRVPPYQSTSFTQTYVCARSLTDVPACTGTTTNTDKASIRIPNVLSVNLPCHQPTTTSGQVWGFDAWAVPPMSSLSSYVDIAFTKGGVDAVPTKSFGVGLSHLYITQVTYNSVTDAELMKAHLAEFSVKDRSNSQVYWEQDVPDVCNLQLAKTKLVYDFWDSCAATWTETPPRSLWRTQTEKDTCYCYAPDMAPARLYKSDNYYPWIRGFESFGRKAQYYWWYGYYNDGTTNTPSESAPNAYLPADAFDDDVDGVPNNCDLCPLYNDKIDSDMDMTPDGCDKCPGGDDRVDANWNGIPDDCDLCFTSSVAGDPSLTCSPLDTCTNVGLNQFSCTCAPGFKVKGPAFLPASFSATFFASNAARYIPWVASHPDIISSNLDSYTVATITGAVTSLTIPIRFVLKHDLTNSQVKDLFDDFRAVIDLSLQTCTDCGIYQLTHTFTYGATDVNNDVTTTFTLWIQPYKTAQTYTGLTLQAGVARGCEDINECSTYGCGANSACYESVLAAGVDEKFRTGFNERLCVCNAGFSGDRLLVGSAKFSGCVVAQSDYNTVDECKSYGCASSVPERVAGICSLGPQGNQRTCTCPTGFVTAEAKPFTTLTEAAPFTGCVAIDFCKTAPCGANAICTNSPTAAVCACKPGFWDTKGDGRSCIDPCEMNNGGCQDVCNSPADGKDYSCGCDDEFARIALDGRECQCKPGFFGNGLTCEAEASCKVYNAFGEAFLPEPEPLADDADETSAVCGGYSDNSCCDLSRNVFDREQHLNYAGDGRCADHLETLYCSVCDPEQHFIKFQSNTLVVTVCADFCQQLFEACAEAFPADSETEVPQYLVGDFRDPLAFCEQFLVDLLPFNNGTKVPIFLDARGTDKDTCFSSGSVLQPVLLVVAAVVSLFSL